MPLVNRLNPLSLAAELIIFDTGRELNSEDDVAPFGRLSISSLSRLEDDGKLDGFRR